MRRHRNAGWLAEEVVGPQTAQVDATLVETVNRLVAGVGDVDVTAVDVDSYVTRVLELDVRLADLA